MDNKTGKEKVLKVNSGIQAGIWFTMGAGMGSVQVVPNSNNGATFSAPTTQVQQPKIVA